MLLSVDHIKFNFNCHAVTLLSKRAYHLFKLFMDMA